MWRPDFNIPLLGDPPLSHANLGLVLVLTAVGGITTACEVDEPKTFQLADGDSFVVRLKVRPDAFMGAPRWLVLEIENVSDNPREIISIDLRADATLVRGPERTPISHTNLVSGALPRPANIVDGGNFVLGKGCATVSDFFSQHAGTSLGLFEDEIEVQTRWFGSIRFRDGSSVDLPREGVSVHFPWHPAPAEQISELANRLRSLYVKNGLSYEEFRELSVLLAAQPFRETLSEEEFRQAILAISDYNHRMMLAGHFVRRFPTQGTVEFYATRIGKGDLGALEELASMDALDSIAPEVWREGVVPRLVNSFDNQTVTLDQSHVDLGLRLLGRHRELWDSDDRTPGILARAVLRSPLLSKSPSDLTEAELIPWIARARSLGRTGQKRQVTRLEPFLAVKRLPTGYRMMHRPGGFLDLSVEEAAAIAILELLGRKPLSDDLRWESLPVRGEELVQSARDAIAKGRESGQIPTLE